MTERKSLPRYSLRQNRQSIRSQISGILNPDSNIDSDDGEGNPLWFKHLENSSQSIRQSQRFSSVQNQTPVLDADSEPESTPLEKSWWKNLNNTPDVRRSKSNVSKETSNNTEKSNLESSDTSSLEGGVARLKSVLRRNKRKNSQRNVFSEVLESSESTVSFEKIGRNTENQDEEETTVIPSVSDSDVSLEKVRKLPFKKKRTTRPLKKSTTVKSTSDEIQSDVFQDALDILIPIDKTRHESTAANEFETLSGNRGSLIPHSLNSETMIRLRKEPITSRNGSIVSDMSQDTVLAERSDVETSNTSSLEKGIARKKSTLRRNKRKSSQRNVFSQVLESSESTISFEKFGRNTQNQDEQETSVSRSISDSDISLEKVRKLPFKKKRKEEKSAILESKSNENLTDVFKDALHAPESINETRHSGTGANEPEAFSENQEPLFPGSPDSQTSIRLELEPAPSETTPIVYGESENTALADDDSEGSQSRLMSRPKKRTIFTKASTRKTPNFEDFLSSGSNENASDQALIGEELAMKQNKADKEASTEPSETGSQSNPSTPEDESHMEESIKKQRPTFGHKTQKNHQAKMFAQPRESFNTSVHFEPVSDRKKRREFESPRHEIRSAKRHSSLERNYPTDNSGHLNLEIEENQIVIKSIRRSTSVNRPDTNRRSINNKNNRIDTSHSSNTEAEENRSARIRPSSNTNKSATERLSTNETNDSKKTSPPSNIELEENRFTRAVIRRSDAGNRSHVERRSINKTSDATETFHLSNVGVEDNQPMSISLDGSGGANKPRNSIQNKNSLNHFQINKERSSSRDENVSRRVLQVSNQKSTSEQLASDEEEGDEETSKNVDDPTSASGSIDRMQKDQEYSMDPIPQPQDIDTTHNTEITTNPSVSHSTNKNTDQSQTASRTRPRSMSMRNVEKEIEALQENNQDTRKESNRSRAADGIENFKAGESRFTNVETTVQSFRNAAEHSSLPVDHNRSRLVQQPDMLSRPVSQVSNAEKVSQIRTALETVKRKELALMKNAKIDSYFKSTLAMKPNTAVQDPQKVPNNTKLVAKKRKTVPAHIDKAYLVDGKVYQRPKLPRPKTWVTDRLYNYLWKRLEPKYKLKTRIRSEKFIIDLSQVVALVVRRQKYKNYEGELNNLIREMARLDIIKTRNDFNIFCQDFLPYDFRIKVIPMILPGNVRNIPFEPHKLHTPIF